MTGDASYTTHILQQVRRVIFLHQLLLGLHLHCLFYFIRGNAEVSPDKERQQDGRNNKGRGYIKMMITKHSAQFVAWGTFIFYL